MSDYDKVSYWLDSAQYDLETARAMLKTGRFLYVGFMCHQTIEKALKAVFVSRKADEELPYIHKLVRLANVSGISSEMSEAQLTFLDTLSPLNIEARYPAYKERLLSALTEEKCNEFIKETEGMLSWLTSKC